MTLRGEPIIEDRGGQDAFWVEPGEEAGSIAFLKRVAPELLKRLDLADAPKMASVLTFPFVVTSRGDVRLTSLFGPGAVFYGATVGPVHIAGTKWRYLKGAKVVKRRQFKGPSIGLPRSKEAWDLHYDVWVCPAPDDGDRPLAGFTTIGESGETSAPPGALLSAAATDTFDTHFEIRDAFLRRARQRGAHALVNLRHQRSWSPMKALITSTATVVRLQNPQQAPWPECFQE